MTNAPATVATTLSRSRRRSSGPIDASYRRAHARRRQRAEHVALEQELIEVLDKGKEA